MLTLDVVNQLRALLPEPLEPRFELPRWAV